MYWHILAAKLAFVVVFEVISISLKTKTDRKPLNIVECSSSSDAFRKMGNT